MLIDIEKIVIKDRIRKDFGDIQELADDIQANGLINPPVITPGTYELITGERRIRAMKLLGYKQIEVRPMAVKDAEHQLNLEISENEARKDFSKAERIDYARRLERIESLKARERMSDGGKGCQNSDNLRTDDAVAKKLRIGSRDTFRKEKYITENQNSLTPEDFADWDEGKLSTNKAFMKIKAEKEALEQTVKELESQQQSFENYEHLTEMIPELEDLIDTGIVTKDTALAIMKNLSEEEQERFISSLDTTKKITKREMQKYIDKIQSLQKANKDLKEDALLISDSTISALREENKRLETENQILESQKEISDRLAAQYKANSEEYMDVKEKLVHMGLEPGGEYNIFQATVQLTELNSELAELLQNRLAPLKYQPYMFAVKENMLLKKNFMNTLSMLHDWYLTILSYLGEDTDENIIEIKTEEVE